MVPPPEVIDFNDLDSEQREALKVLLGDQQAKALLSASPDAPSERIESPLELTDDEG